MKLTYIRNNIQFNILKGSDMAMFGVENNDKQNDEIYNYQLGRYISSNEAVWRILGISKNYYMIKIIFENDYIISRFQYS